MSTDAYRDALAQPRTVTEIAAIVRTAARAIVGCEGATFVLREEGNCYYADEDAIAPLWKGQRFPLGDCISGWAMLHAAAAVVPDIYADDRIPHEAYRPTFVRALLMTPVGTPPIAAIGMYWIREHAASEAEMNSARELAAATEAAIARVGLDGTPWAPNFRLAATDQPAGRPARSH